MIGIVQTHGDEVARAADTGPKPLGRRHTGQRLQVSIANALEVSATQCSPREVDTQRRDIACDTLRVDHTGPFATRATKSE